MGDKLKELRDKQWLTGKDAVAAVRAITLSDGRARSWQKKGGTFWRLCCTSKSPCGWFVNISRTRSQRRVKYWHVTSAILHHTNCTGTARPTALQLAATSVLRSTVIADPEVSASTLESQLQLDANVVCGRGMLYRAKQLVLSEVFSENLQTIELLPSYLAMFAKQNRGVYTEVARDSYGHFTRAIIALNPAWFVNGLRLFGVDAAHMKHNKYNGVQIVLVARDGNLRNRVVAVALAPIEDHANYHWFFSAVIAHGFPLQSYPVFSDRHAGIISASLQLNLFNMFCTRHLIGNMRAGKDVKLAVGFEGIVWRAQAAETKALYDTAVADLGAVNAPAGAYLRALAPDKWSLYPRYRRTPLFGWRTTNFVESEQAKALRLKPRLMPPYEFFCAYAKIMMSEACLQLEHGNAWQEAGRLVTPRAEAKFQGELRQVPSYTVAFSSPAVAFVARREHPSMHRRVDIDISTCSCLMWLQHGITCRYILAGLNSRNRLHEGLSLLDKCYTVESYLHNQQAIELPTDSSLTADLSILPARFQRQAGRPRKRRVRSKGEAGSAPRALKLYRCEKCGIADGHNSRTCRALL